MNIIILTLVRPNLPGFKKNSRTGHRIIAYKEMIYFEHKLTTGV